MSAPGRGSGPKGNAARGFTALSVIRQLYVDSVGNRAARTLLHCRRDPEILGIRKLSIYSAHHGQ
jgi:hypothetical protein